MIAGQGDVLRLICMFLLLVLLIQDHPALSMEAAIYLSRGYALDTLGEPYAPNPISFRASPFRGGEVEFWPGPPVGLRNRIAHGIRLGLATVSLSPVDPADNPMTIDHSYLSSVHRMNWLRKGAFTGACDAGIGLAGFDDRSHCYYPCSGGPIRVVVDLALTGTWRISEVFGIRGKIGERRVLGDESMAFPFSPSTIVQAGVAITQ